MQRALSVGSTVAPINKHNRHNTKDSKQNRKNSKSRPSYAGSTSKKPRLQNESELIEENEEHATGKSYECGVCDFVSSNHNDFQVFFAI